MHYVDYVDYTRRRVIRLYGRSFLFLVPRIASWWLIWDRTTRHYRHNGYGIDMYMAMRSCLTVVPPHIAELYL